MKKILISTTLLSLILLFSNFQTIIFDVFSSKADVSEFINYETAHCHPIDMTPDGTKLLAVNIANYSLEVFEVSADGLTQIATIPVGVDPVTVRAFSNTEAWVVNTISDNISIVDLVNNVVTKTIEVANEPWDVVFAGNPQKAFVSSAEPSILSIYDISNLDAAPIIHKVIGEDLRALAVSPDGLTVYGAFFESGNQSTVIQGNLGSETNSFAPDISSEISKGPYGSTNAPPNNGSVFEPPLGPAGLPPHARALPVKKNAAGQWMDDNGGDWSNVVSGGAGVRVNGWDMPDRDIVVFDVNAGTLNYQHHMGNMLMAMDVNPVSSEVFVVGTDGINEIRFEPNLLGKFIRVNVSKFAQNNASQVVDINPHLDYQTTTLPINEKLKSIGDPRGIKWLSDGSKAYVTGMGSNNVVSIDAAGERVGVLPISVGEGPTGIVLDENSNRAYVLNKFDGSISVIDIQSDCEIEQVPFFDPTPQVIKDGRKFLYDTQFGSGTGHLACASCHIDGKYDRLAWDLGNPAGDWTDIPSTVVNFDFGNPNERFHPMKGLTVTTALIDIVKPNTLLHWRGDKSSLLEFSETFVLLQGRETEPTPSEMQLFADFLAETYYVPNPNRNLDNTFKTAMELPSPYNETPLVGNALQGLDDYLTTGGNQECLKCHEPNTGRGDLTRLTLTPHRMPAGFRANYDQTGFWKKSVDGSTSGFGFFSDGTLDSRFKFFEGDFGEVRLDALVYSFEGSDLVGADPADIIHFSQDSHAAVGKQVTVNGPYTGNQQPRLAELKSIVESSGRITFIVSALYQNEIRQLFYAGSNVYQSDKSAQTLTHTELESNALAGNPTTWTIVFDQVKEQTSVDKNNNGIYDRDELIANFDSKRQLPYDMAALVDFDASLTYEVFGNALDYSWDFGDGNSGSGLNPMHSYSSPGTYLVTLTVTDPITNSTNTISKEIEIIPGCVNLVGTTCTDPCYTTGVILPDCSCSGIKTIDSDFDGLCDNIDTCPDFDNDLIGMPCDDSDPCTDNDVWRIDCSCLGDFADLDSDSICDFYDLDADNDGITDATELGCSQAEADRTNLSTPAGNQFVEGNLTTSSASATFIVNNSDASLSTSSSYHFDGAGISYNFRDQSPNMNTTIDINPNGSTILSKVLWGPDLMNINNSQYDNNSQTITLTWNLSFDAIVHDPNNQLTLADGTAIVSGSSITQSSNQNNGSGTWYIEFDLSTNTNDFELSIDHSDSNDLDFEGYSFVVNLCVLEDYDNDNIYNHLDLDSDGDGCFDALEGSIGGNGISVSDIVASGSIIGLVDMNGIPQIANGGQNVGSSLSPTLGLGCPCTDAQLLTNNCDLDGDNIVNFYDWDDDNDGITDATELGCSQANAERTNLSTPAGNQFVEGDFTTANASATFIVDNSDASLSTSSSYHFDGAGISYNFRDQSPNMISTISITPVASAILSKVLWGPDLMDINNSQYDNDSQTITLTWNSTFEATIHDPDNQLTIADGTGVLSGSSITQSNNQNDGSGTWYVEFDLSTNTSDFQLSIDHSDSDDLGFEGYSFVVALCVLEDFDNDSIYNHLDVDSDGDGCFDALEGSLGGNGISVNDIAGNGSVMGMVDINGIPQLANGGQEVGSSLSPSLGLGCPCTDAQLLTDNCDLDGDNIVNFYDWDDDNDGITDATELGCSQATAVRTNLSTPAGNQFVEGDFTIASAGASFIVDNSDASLSTSSSYHFDGAGISYNFRDQSSNMNSTISINPVAPAILSKVLWGPDLMNINNSRYDNNSQTIMLSWNSTFEAIVHDPDNQLTIADGTAIVSGSSITQSNNQNNGQGTWYIEFDLSTNTSEFLLSINHSDTNDLDFEGYSFVVDLCVLADYDNDNIYNHLDLDSDGDNCADALDGGGSLTFADIDLNTFQLLGNVDNNGVPNIVNGGQTVGDSQKDQIQSAECSCSLIQGNPCEDGDQCTSGEVFDANCNCSGGIFQDADSDGVCDVEDQCAGSNDAVIGTSCDDGDVCTTGELYDSNCNCSGGIFQDVDNDGICDALDNDCEPFDIHSDNNVITESMNVENYIHSNGRVLTGSNIDFKAGEYILLSGEFEVELGSVFHALIEDCQ